MKRNKVNNKGTTPYLIFVPFIIVSIITIIIMFPTLSKIAYTPVSYDINSIEKVDDKTYVADINIMEGDRFIGSSDVAYFNLYYDINNDGDEEKVGWFIDTVGGGDVVFELSADIEKGEEVKIKSEQNNKNKNNTYIIK